MPGKRLLNEDQVAAVTHGDGPLLIIAGAGTGKTTVITERIAHLILKKKIPPSQILALTFTEKAASEMEERIDIIMPYGYTHMWISTFHGFCDRILRQESIHIGLDSGYKLVTEAQMVLFVRKNLFTFNLEYFRPLGNPNKFITAMLQHFSRLQDEDISPEEYLKYAEKISNFKSIRQAQDLFEPESQSRRPESIEGFQISNKELSDSRYMIDAEKIDQKKTLELAHAYKTFEDLKIKEGMLDFSNLIGNTLKLFRQRPNILAQYQKQFQYILIDEFQDTNYAQNELAILLAGKQKNITVVGDDDQSVYKWRGAAVSNMIQFRKHFPDTKIITLTKNYRSTQTILDSAYRLILHNNPDRLEVKEHIDKKLQELRNIAGEEIELSISDRGENEAELVARKIQEIVKKSSKGRSASGRKYDYKDFAILVRANDHAQPFIRCFERLKIPYQFLGPGQLFHQEEIKDLIAYLHVLVNYEDSISLYRVLCMPILNLSGTTIATVLNLAKKRNIPLFRVCLEPENLPIPDSDKEKIAIICNIIRKHLDLVSKESAGYLLLDFLKETGFIQNMLDPKTIQEQTQMENIAKFFDKLKTFESESDENSVFAVTEWIDLSMLLGESPLAAHIDWSENDAVNILTVHSSKGLEFSVVFLVNLIKDRFPSRERREQIPVPQDLIKEELPEGDFHLQEERRLFYVAMTRAKDKLFFSASKFYGEGKRERKLSPFVLESLGIEIVENLQSQRSTKANQLSFFEFFPQADAHRDNTSNGQKKPLAINYLSYSQIQTFDTCPLHYKLRYVLKIPTPQSAAFSFGTSVHTVLREFYQRHKSGDHIPLDGVDQILERYWIPDGYDSKDHEQLAHQKALYIIKNYLENEFNPDNLPIAIELPFDFFIQHQEGAGFITNGESNGKTKNLKIGGRIDRIDGFSDGTIEIIDYKTGSNIPDEKKLANDLQLTTYALAASMVQEATINRSPEQIRLSLYYVEENKKFTTTRTKEQLEEAKSLLLQKAGEIASSDFFCSRSIYCRNCEYKMLCTT